ncbi:Tail-anchored protein insertion receptor WRB [Spatholobus suberectus]|nr:Tail-anchored protein insertion receptor WRB [Spatholobus suberectus]
MGDEASQERERSLAAPLIFLIVAAFQFAYYCLDHVKKSGSDNEKEIQLRAEIKQLLKEASSMSQPSTFAQAAKLKRLAAAKERELSQYQNSCHKDTALYSKVLLILKYLTYGVLLIWFWRVPVASISQQLVQPFGCLLSWKTGGVQNNSVMIGIISWLVVSARVCRFVRRAYSK